MMEKRIKNYLDEVFAPYDSLKRVKELKEELYSHLMEKLQDLENEGYDDETAFKTAIESVGEISEIVESINHNLNELEQFAKMSFSKSNLKGSDFSSIKAQNKKFDFSNLEGSDFSHSDLQNSSFRCSNLANANFRGSKLQDCSFRSSNLAHSNFDGGNLTGAKIVRSNLKGASFKGCMLNDVDFSYSNLSGICFDNQSFSGTVFDHAGLKGTSFKNSNLTGVSFRTDVKKTIFKGATMDKLTYAILKGYKADLTDVIVK